MKSWLKNRLYDIYGEDGKPYYYECAVIFFGIFQYLSFYWNLATNTTIDIKKVICRSLRYVENFLPEMIACGEVFLDPRDMYLIESEFENKIVTKDIILEKLGKFDKNMSTVELPQQSIELTSLLLDEICREKPRISVLEIMLKPFRNAFNDTVYTVEAEEIANIFWLYIKMQKNRS